MRCCITRCIMYLRLLLVLVLLVVSISGAESVKPRRENKKSKCLNPPRTARRVETVIEQCQEEVKNKLVNEALQILREEIAKTESETFHEAIVSSDSNLFTSHLENRRPAATPTPSSYWPTAAATEESPVSVAYEEPVAEWSTTAAPLVAFLPTLPPSERGAARLLHRIRRRLGEMSSSGGIYTPMLVPLEEKRIAGCLLHCVYAKNNAIDDMGWPTLDGLVDFYSDGVNEHGFFMATLRSVNLCLRAVTNKYHVDRRRLPQKGESCDLAFDVFDCISDQITGYCLDQYRQ